MNKYWKRKWVEALESGKYRQGKGQLCEPAEHGGHAKYCCLGILCKIIPGFEWNKGAQKTGEIMSGTPYKSDGYLSKELIDKFGLTQEQQESLAKLNDDGVPFKEIAIHIKENL